MDRPEVHPGHSPLLANASVGVEKFAQRHLLDRPDAVAGHQQEAGHNDLLLKWQVRVVLFQRVAGTARVDLVDNLEDLWDVYGLVTPWGPSGLLEQGLFLGRSSH